MSYKTKSTFDCDIKKRPKLDSFIVQAHVSCMLHQIYSSICFGDEISRKPILDELYKTLENLTLQPGDNTVQFPSDIQRCLRNYKRHHKIEDADIFPSLHDHAIFLLNCSINCPLEDLRKWCLETLSMLEKQGVSRAYAKPGVPSTFVPPLIISAPSNEDWIEFERVESLNIANDERRKSSSIFGQALFLDAFLQNNRLDNITQIIGYHPKYLELFLKTQHFILKGDGPLPYTYRHYIAIMAAARHQCTYIIDQQKQEFLLQGGNALWLQGLEYVPQKLRNLQDINKILAHRPWLMNKNLIQKLAKGKDNWSMTEIVHAIVILAHFHSICSFIYGTGIMAEIDHPSGHTFSPPPSQAHHYLQPSQTQNGSSVLLEKKEEVSEVGVEELVQKMQYIKQKPEPSLEEKVHTFNNIENQCAELAADLIRNKPTIKSDVYRFLEDIDFTYEDYVKRTQGTDIPTFRIQDYSWDDHGFSLANRLYNDIGLLLDYKFKTAYDLTYYTMGEKSNIDTSMFRRAIWNYIQCLYGIRHDDYDYKEVNDLIDRRLKSHIKTICCYPDRTSKDDYDSVMRDFRHSEKVHVILMLFEARMQAELLYALRAIMQYMT